MEHPRTPGRSRNRVTLPVRLLGRLPQELSYENSVGLERAVRWESAAVLARLTMSEWAFGAMIDAISGRPATSWV